MPSFSVSRSTALVCASLLFALLVVAGPRLAGTGAASGDSGASETVAPLEPVSTPATSSRLVVHVVGAVNRPGLYHVREGGRVADAVQRAGGATGAADLAGLNLAAPLVDGTQILVSARVVPASESASAADSSSEGVTGAGLAAPGAMQTTSLATATAEQLDELPGVGPVTAQKILDYRAEHGPFRSVDELDAVPGIGPTRIEQLRDLVTP
jgi:competence protein ComEA